ncbi:transcriptional regulator, TetR family [Lentzea albidocapillata subsp. violacea]|uniref:Transcriptional regulator, TetR family n=1 Tax=Lentzea albidocapillata subsp. violacea TaxID=128104 RepID=A0A1G8QXS4_9PSEU|nr:TetR/AcrR family transcriptional regulator [Lentzea albidocapillata]SDJ09552.1 transcriptional regulator, TetR family [Lentzea albidocapillata subsp. violacea]
MEPVALPLGRPREERADAARNRAHLIEVAREMVAELGADKVTMDGLAERAGLGKGTVFRRFRTRAGIFHTLLDEEEKLFQERVMTGPPPLGPGAPAAERLVAFGRARLEFLVEHTVLARASLDPGRPVPAGDSPSLFHVHMLLTEACPDDAASGTLALQLVAALEGPILLYLRTQDEDAPDPEAVVHNLTTSWQVLVERVCG